ncbi:MAG: basic amino acid ABC transporter substrate-binding protein [Succinivibrio sp.]
MLLHYLNLIAKVFILAVALISFQLQAKPLRVGTETSFPPFEYKDERGNLVGFDIDLMNAIARISNLDIEYVELPFNDLVTALSSNRVDIVIAAMSITESRSRFVDFSTPYFISGLSLLIRKNDVEKYVTIDDLNTSRICAQTGTTGSKYMKSISGLTRIYDKTNELYKALVDGRCDAILNDRPINQYKMFINPSVYSEIKEYYNNEYYAIAVNRNNLELLGTINKALVDLKKNGSYRKLYMKWFQLEE